MGGTRNTHEEKKDAHPILTCLDERLPARSFDRAMVLAPSPVAAAALRRACTTHCGALLGVDFVTATGLARNVLLLAGESHTAETPDALEERAALRSLLPAGDLGAYAGRFDGALSELHGLLRELDLAPPQRDDAPPLSRDGEDVLTVHAVWREHFAGRGGRSRLLATAARVAAEGRGTPPATVIAVGGAAKDFDTHLLLEVLEGRGVTIVHAQPAAIEATGSWHSHPDVFREMRAAARQCLVDAATGIPWSQMVLAAPRLQPYVAEFARAFEIEGVPVHTAAEEPLRNDPRAALSLHLAHLLLDDSPRESFLGVVGSRWLASEVAPEEVARFDQASRRASLMGGTAATEEFADRLADDGRCRSVVALLRRIARARRAIKTTSFAAFASALQTLFDELVTPSDGIADERRKACLAAIPFADRGDGEAHFLTEWDALLRERTIPIAASVRHGVHFVTQRDALAIPCRRLHILGLADGQFPLGGPPTTLVSEAVREELRLETADASRREQEDRLSALLQHAEHVHLHWSRTDARGMPRTISRWAHRCDQLAPLDETERTPSNPRSEANAAAEAQRCPDDLALLDLAFKGCDDASAYARFVTRPAERLAQIDALESFHDATLGRDGDVGADLGSAFLENSLAVTAIGGLARCPQQFLFERVMKIRPLAEEREPLALQPGETGTLIHGALDGLFKQFAPRLQSAEDPLALRDEILAAAKARLDESFAGATSPMQRLFPGLYRLQLERWRDSLCRALGDDLASMAEDGSRVEAAEEPVRSELLLTRPAGGEPITFRLHGNLDRRDRLADGSWRILDFKTGRKPENIVDPNEILTGKHMQLLLYAALHHDEVRDSLRELESRAVRPGDDEDKETRLPLPDVESFLQGESAVAVRESLAVLAQLVARGLFAPNDSSCRYCGFRAACRRHHPPSAHRVTTCEATELVHYRRMLRKSKSKPLLADVEGGS